MSYFDDFDGPNVADYAADREREQDMERWHTRRSTMDRYSGPTITRLCGPSETIVFIGDEGYIHVPKAIGDRANALRDKGASFDRFMGSGDRPGHVNCLLPDGTLLKCAYGLDGIDLNDALGVVVGLAEREMGVTT